MGVGRLEPGPFSFERVKWKGGLLKVGSQEGGGMREKGKGKRKG